MNISCILGLHDWLYHKTRSGRRCLKCQKKQLLKYNYRGLFNWIFQYKWVDDESKDDFEA